MPTPRFMRPSNQSPVIRLLGLVDTVEEAKRDQLSIFVCRANPEYSFSRINAAARMLSAKICPEGPCLIKIPGRQALKVVAKSS